VGNYGKALSESCDFLFARKQATRETNAAARTLFDSGADQVIVWDSHGCAYHFKTVRQTLKAIVYRRRGWKPMGPRTIEKDLNSMLDWNC
jgi:D-aminopeptidase